MRRGSVSDLHARTGAIVDEEMRAQRRVAPREAAQKLKTLWDSLPQVKADSGKFLEEDR